jgi:peptidoglycan/xylan/chitin deacetylase (PgdA/CDA1 family)
MKGTFTISLDFELHWGGFEKWRLEKVGGGQEAVGRGDRLTINKELKVDSGKSSFEFQASSFELPVSSYNQYFLNTRQVIPEMLELFRKHEIHVTWATVGILMHESKQQLMQNVPLKKPSYEEKKLSAYHYIDTIGIGENEEMDPFHFAPGLIKKILATPHQELGSHTFSHFYCNEAGQTADQFREDLKSAQRVAKNYGVELKSLVFPRNQFNDQYLKVCFEEGITSVRSNPLDWFWKIDSTQDESRWKRLNRGVDAYFPIGERNTYPISSLIVREGYPVCLPASRLLRPYRPKEFFLNDFKIKRIKSEMTRAAQHGEVYHLWWHPHNFGRYPSQNLEGLKEILVHYQSCKEKYGMQSLTMNEITRQVRNED